MEIDPSALQRMWISFFAIGVMVASALLVSFARTRTKGWIKVVLTIIAVIMLLIGLVYAFFSIF